MPTRNETETDVAGRRAGLWRMSADCLAALHDRTLAGNRGSMLFQCERQ